MKHLFTLLICVISRLRRALPFRSAAPRLRTIVNRFAVIAVYVICGQISEAADRPNIVLIMADDMGYECLSSNGSLDYQTPYPISSAHAMLSREYRGEWSL